jgi:hypothetical protein
MEKVTKPIAKVTGEDGNVFSTMAICTKALKRAGLDEKAKEMSDRCFDSGSYEEAIAIMAEYCELR